METTDSTQSLETSKKSWKRDPDGVRQNILAVARSAFAEKGLSGTRIEEIASRTKTSKRMIYYYFDDKEGLYREVLAEAYREMRFAEDALDLKELNPADALRVLAEFTFDHHRNAKDFIRLVMIENVHDGIHMPDDSEISGQNSSAILLLEDIYSRGCKAGIFRLGLSAVELHWHISALSYFNVSNQATFSRLFGSGLFDTRGQEMLRRHVGDMILRFAMRSSASPESGSHRATGTVRNINPNLTKFLEDWDQHLAGMQENDPIEELRQRFDRFTRKKRLPTPISVDTDEEHWIETTTGPVRVRLFRHVDELQQPCLVYFHGGGWISGSPESHWDIASRIAAWNKQTVISVDYALAPENKFPVATDQCFEAVRWVFDNHERLRILPDAISVGGDGAGGNLAAITAIRCAEKSLPLLGQLLVYPFCDFDFGRPSILENSDGPVASLKMLERCMNMYLPSNMHEKSCVPGDWLQCASPNNLAPAYFALAQYDPLCDGGLTFAETLSEIGVKVEIEPGEGLTHGYLHAMGYCPEAEEILRQIAAWLEGLESKTP